ncbi:MAG: TIGR01440 family protein [Clostridia bacterium]|nr:TIGR01440 family protein [Clostridia bacterium]
MIRADAEKLTRELIEASGLCARQILVVGCSSSEVTGNKIGKASVPSVADAILDGMLPVLNEKGIYLAAQCCEHLNRAIIIENELAERLGIDVVCVRPVPKAGGSFAAACYERFSSPVAVEHIRAHAGLDIGGTLIGMHLREVAVPVRLSVKALGEAPIICARTRPKYIGGERARYN